MQPSLSPSRAGDFERCPQLFRFRTIDKLPEPPSPAALRGRLVHLVLERLFDLPAGGRTPPAAHSLLPDALTTLQADEPQLDHLFSAPQERQAWLAGAHDLVESYFYLEDPSAIEPEAKETWVRATLEDGLTLRGIVDRLDVAPGNGALRLVDYKTGKSPAPRFHGEVLFQLRFYSLILWLSRGQVPAVVQLLYLGNRDIVRQSPTAADLERTKLKILTLWDSIVLMAGRREFPPVKSPLCPWCSFQAQCRLFGGVPPPWPADAATRLGLGPNQSSGSGATAAGIRSA